MPNSTIHTGDCRLVLPTLAAGSVHTVVTSPPYWGLREYGEGQGLEIGGETSPQEFVNALAEVFREVRRVLRDDGTLWLNLGDCFARNGGSGGPGASAQVANTKSGVQRRNCKAPEGFKPKDLIGIPWRVAFALQQDGWYLRSDIVWHKLNAMPESVTDRPTRAHEYIFLFAKSERYYYDHEAVKEDAVSVNPVERRNKRSVWGVNVKPFDGDHRATFPPDLIEPCILAGAPIGGLVMDPFSGAGTTGLVANRHGRDYLGIELYAKNADLGRNRIQGDAPLFNQVS